MTLALFVGKCEESLICDMAETYHIFNWRELPLKTAAVLASGLSQDSRCFRKVHDQKLRSEEYTLVGILDELRTIRWLLTSDAQKGRNRPESVLMSLLEPKKNKTVGFRTAEEFESVRSKILAG